MRRRQVHTEAVKGDRWIVSYADLLTLLFCFFVVMYSISSLDSEKYQLLSSSLEDQLSDQLSDQATDQSELVDAADQGELSVDDRFTHELLTRAETQINQIADDVEDEFHELIDEERVRVKRNKFWLEIEFKSNLLYPSGSSELLSDAVPILVSLAHRLASMDNRLNIEGFTDNRPINNQIFPSNWELSAARAATVVRLFEENGVEPQRMASIGYGEHQPIADNATDQGRALNRRVVVVVMAEVDGNPRIYQLDQLNAAPQTFDHGVSETSEPGLSSIGPVSGTLRAVSLPAWASTERVQSSLSMEVIDRYRF